MRIGFIQPDDDEPSITGVGYAETGAEESEDDGSWLFWGARVLFYFCFVYGLIALIHDLIEYVRAW